LASVTLEAPMVLADAIIPMLLISLADLPAEIVDLAIGLGLSLIATDNTDDLQIALM
jgi:hypothetical protein